MRTNPRRLAAAALVTAATVLAAGCAASGHGTASGDGGTTASRGDEVTMNLRGAPTSWNVLSLNGYNDLGFEYTWPFMPHAFAPDTQGTMQLNTALLASAKVTSTNPMKIVYQIKPQAKWSDGTPITAADFIYTWKVQDPAYCPKCQAGTTSGYTNISSIQGSDNGKTVTVTFSTPFQPWEYLFDAILPAHIAAKSGSMADSFNDAFSQSPPTWSGGPFIVSHYQPNTSITYKPNPQWYGPSPKLKEFTLLIISNASAALTAFQNGELQVFDSFASQSAVQTLKEMPNTTVSIQPTLINYQMMLQAAGNPLGNRTLRRAITIATSAAAATARTVGLFEPGAQVMQSAVFVPGQEVDGQVGYRDDASALGVGSGNTKEALALLKGAGYTLKGGALYEPNGTRVRALNAVTYSADPIRVELAEVVQVELKSIGITVNIDSVGPTEYVDRIDSKDFDILFTGLAFEMQSASAAAYYTAGAPLNWLHYDNPQVNSLLAKAQEAANPQTAISLMNQADKLILGDGVVVPFFSSPNLMAYPSDLTGVSNTASRYGTTVSLAAWAYR